MKVRVYPMKYDGDGSYYEDGNYKNPPLNGAVSENTKYQQIYTDKSSKYREPYADIVDGKPVILYKIVETWPDKNTIWFKHGFDHTYDATTHTYTRWFNELAWFVEADYQQIVEWLANGDAYEVDKTEEGYVLRVYV